MRRLLVICVACGGTSSLPPAPDTLTAGPVTIDTHAGSLTVAGMTATDFLAVGDTPSIDPTHYYDPAKPEVDLAAPHVAGIDGDFVRLDDGTKSKLLPGAIAGST